MEALAEEKVRLLREIAQLKASGKSLNISNPEEEGSGYYYTSPSNQVTNNSKSTIPTTVANFVPKVSSADATISSIGALRLYEFLLGIFFVAAMLNWIVV